MGRRELSLQAVTLHHLPLFQFNSHLQGEELGLPGHDKEEGVGTGFPMERG